MADPREDFEYELARDSEWTENGMKYSRAEHGGYQNRELNLIYRGWRLARTQAVRAALRGNSERSGKV
jgi:phage terminase Nu1 subunit (DNA packaging protein)